MMYVRLSQSNLVPPYVILQEITLPVKEGPSSIHQMLYIITYLIPYSFVATIQTSLFWCVLDTLRYFHVLYLSQFLHRSSKN